MGARDGRLDRRGLLLGGLGAFGASTFLARSARAAVRLGVGPALAEDGAVPPLNLVLIQLSGGNDGLNTLVPVGDAAYHRARPTLRLAENEVLALDGDRGLHPELRGVKELWDEGRVALIQGAGYPTPNRSHFKSLEIWHTARLAGRDSGDGWIGRLAEELFGADADPDHVVHVGAAAPYSLHSSKHPAACFTTPAGYRWAANEDELEELAARNGHVAAKGSVAPADRLAWLRSVMQDARNSSAEIRAAVARHRPRAAYPRNDPFAEALYAVAGLVQARIGTRVFSVELDGFDTHNDELARHRNRMRTLDRGLTCFLRDLLSTEAGDRTTVLVFSEFGRRVAENASRGTDHGTASTMFALGAPVRGGLVGEYPSLEDLDDGGDLRFTTDFRSVYQAVIEDGFGVDSERVLGRRYPRLELFEQRSR